jgi:hypothetical protein
MDASLAMIDRYCRSRTVPVSHVDVTALASQTT